MNDEQANAENSRVLWHSRRGMLELDIVLEPFARHCYPQLPDNEQARYRRLLDCEDQELFDWFLKKRPVDDAELAATIEQVLAFQRQNSAGS